MTVHRTQAEIRLAIEKLWEEYEEYKKVRNSFKEGSSANKHMRWIYSKIQHEEEMLERRRQEDLRRERNDAGFTLMDLIKLMVVVIIIVILAKCIFF